MDQERVEQRIGEVLVDLAKLVSQERVQQRTAEVQLERISEGTQIVDVPVPQILVELVPQERVQQRTAEQIEDAPQFLKETVKMPKISCPESAEVDPDWLRAVMQHLDTERESASRFFERIRERLLEQVEKKKILRFFSPSEEGLLSIFFQATDVPALARVSLCR